MRGDRSGDCTLRTSEYRPSLIPGGPGGSSSRVPPGSICPLDASVVDAVAKVVRDGVGWALMQMTPPPEPASRRKRRLGRGAFGRKFDSGSQAPSSTESGEEEPTPRDHATRKELRKTREIRNKILVTNPLYKDVFERET